MPSRKYRVCFWTTTFQADILTFARYLGDHPGYDVLVVLERPGGFMEEGIQQLLPVKGRFLDRNKLYRTLLKVKLFRPHVVIVDNHLPPLLRLAPKLMVLWHGLGWKGPQDEEEFRDVHSGITRLVGGGREPNPDFLWQCYGPPDLRQRNRSSGFAMENLADLGSAFSDDIINLGAGKGFTKEDLAPYYPFDVVGRPTLLLALTWHYGRALAHWGEDMELYREFFAFAGKIGANVIVRMHDRYRYEESYPRELERLVKGRPNVMLKFKNEFRDNTLDMLVSDVLISNFSAILPYFYLTGKPSIHIYPVAKGQETYAWRTIDRRGGVREREVPDMAYVWKFPPEMNGGLMVNSMDELKEAVRRSLAEPDCCRQKSEDFVKEHFTGADGHTCERIERALRELIES